MAHLKNKEEREREPAHVQKATRTTRGSILKLFYKHVFPVW